MANSNQNKLTQANSNKVFARRSILFLAIQLTVIGVLGRRMRKLQIEDSERYRLLAEENRVNIRIIPPTRGVIYDKNGYTLATNKQNYRIVIIREEAGDVKQALLNLSRLISISHKNRTNIEIEIRKNRAFVPVTVLENLSWEDFAKVAANLPSLPGLVPEVGFSRSYKENEVMAHIVGYVGPISQKDQKRLSKSNPLFQIPKFQIGKTGVERELNSELMGIAGVSRNEVNAQGRIMRELDRTDSQTGKDIQITLNTNLQRFAMARMKGLSASAVIINVESGNINLMASTPSFNPNNLVDGISNKDWNNLLKNSKRPLSNKSVSDAYPPGSLFKMIVAIAALEQKVISEYEEINCSGIYKTATSKHHCWLGSGHGNINLEKGLKRSCDVYFYEIAKRVGIEAIAKTAKAFGLSNTFNLPVSAVSRGLVPDKEWKKSTYDERWSLGDTLKAGIGQGYLLATPLQIAIMTTRLITGTAILPRLINTKDGKIVPIDKPKPLGISNLVLSKIRGGMEAAVNDPDGTAYKSRIIKPNFNFSGKTGTAQVRRITEEERGIGVTKNKDLPWVKRDHALFTGYAPSENPKYAISVIVEHGGSGSAVAAPIARDIMLHALHGKIPPLSSYPKDQRQDIKIRLNQLKNTTAKDIEDTEPFGRNT